MGLLRQPFRRRPHHAGSGTASTPAKDKAVVVRTGGRLFVVTGGYRLPVAKGDGPGVLRALGLDGATSVEAPASWTNLLPVAARQIPGSGVVGLAPDARIMPVRVFFGADDQSRAAGVGPRPDRMAEGIRWAADHGAKVINVSMSTPTDDARLRDAVQHATDRGALVVASAGNRTTAEDKSDGVRYPGGYPEAVAVSAADLGDTVTDDSVHGPHVDLSAPGTNILTTYYGAGDCLISAEGESTSFATAYVSASAALLAQELPHATPADWKHRLEVTASRDRRDARDDLAGWGMVQPYEALTAVMDDSLAGPVAPGSAPHPVAASPAKPLDLRTVSDPLAPQRTAALWWCLGGVSALLALVLGGMLARPGRRRPAGRRRAATQQP